MSRLATRTTFSVLLASSLLWLSACSSQSPKQVYLDPQPTVSNSHPLAGLVVQLQVVDQRAHPGLIQVSNADGKQLTTVTSASSVSQSIENALRQGLARRQIAVNPAAQSSLKVAIIELDSKAVAKSFNYQAVSKAVLKATFHYGRLTITRLYSAEQSNTGSFGVDISKQQQLLNQALSSALTQLLNDPQLIKVSQ